MILLLFYIFHVHLKLRIRFSRKCYIWTYNLCALYSRYIQTQFIHNYSTHRYFDLGHILYSLFSFSSYILKFNSCTLVYNSGRFHSCLHKFHSFKLMHNLQHVGRGDIELAVVGDVQRQSKASIRIQTADLNELMIIPR